MVSNWTGNESRKARAYWTARLQAEALPCSRCGEPVSHGDAYDVDHLVPLSTDPDDDGSSAHAVVTPRRRARGPPWRSLSSP